jgi:hypothetical protein
MELIMASKSFMIQATRISFSDQYSFFFKVGTPIVPMPGSTLSLNKGGRDQPYTR